MEFKEVLTMRRITTHHDGHGLTEDIIILAGGAGPGGASHDYIVQVATGHDEYGLTYTEVGRIQFQCGPRAEAGSIPGLLDSALLAIVADRMESFQAGPYPSRESALTLTKVQEAMHWLRHRADERGRRGVLGTNQK